MRPILLCLSLLLAGPALAAPASIQGLWLTDDHKALVSIAPCGALMCGSTAKILDRAPNVPSNDVHNPDPQLRNRPLVGLKVLTGFSRSGSVWKGGRAYDPQSGKSYRSTLELNPDGSLKVSGCILFICESRRWTRVK